MDVTLDRIVRDIRDIGVRPAELLLVHSSLKSIGHVDGGATRGRRGRFALVGASTVSTRHCHYEDGLAEHS